MELSELQNFDYFIILIVLVSSYFGLKKGFVESFVDFFAWVGSAVIVFDSYEALYKLINSYVPSTFISASIASIGVYAALVISISMFGVRVIKFCSQFTGSNLDKFIGTVFGAIRGFLVGVAIFWSISVILLAINGKDKIPDWFIKAKTYKVLKISSDSLTEALSSEEGRRKFFQNIEKKSDELNDEIKDNTIKKNEEIKKSVSSSEYFEE
jgi:membrane protein required for colicin V production